MTDQGSDKTPRKTTGKTSAKTPVKTRRKTKTQASAAERLLADLQYLNREGWIPREIADGIPEEWHTLERDVEVAAKKQKVTLYLDAPVVRFYRAMGAGYQERINRLLSTWMHMKIAGEIELERVLNDRTGIDAYIDRESDRQLAGVKARWDEGRGWSS